MPGGGGVRLVISAKDKLSLDHRAHLLLLDGRLRRRPRLRQLQRRSARTRSSWSSRSTRPRRSCCSSPSSIRRFTIRASTTASTCCCAATTSGSTPPATSATRASSAPPTSTPSAPARSSASTSRATSTSICASRSTTTTSHTSTLLQHHQQRRLGHARRRRRAGRQLPAAVVVGLGQHAHAHVGYDGRSNVYGVLHGLLVDATYQYGASWLGTRCDYHLLCRRRLLRLALLQGAQPPPQARHRHLLRSAVQDGGRDRRRRSCAAWSSASIAATPTCAPRSSTSCRCSPSTGCRCALIGFYDTNLTWFRILPRQIVAAGALRRARLDLPRLSARYAVGRGARVVAQRHRRRAALLSARA